MMDTSVSIQADGTLIDDPMYQIGSGGGKCYEPCGADEYIDGMSSMGNAPVLPKQEPGRIGVSLGQQQQSGQGPILLVRTVWRHLLLWPSCR